MMRTLAVLMSAIHPEFVGRGAEHVGVGAEQAGDSGLGIMAGWWSWRAGPRGTRLRRDLPQAPR